MFSLGFREYLMLTPGVTEEFERLYKRLNAAFSVAHDDEGALLLALPIGAIVPYLGQDVPKGWLRCDGTAVDRARYPQLFKAIGTRYGASGTTMFNVPDFRTEHPLPYLILAGR